MFVTRALVFVVGAVLAGWLVTSAVRTMVVPRALQSFLARVVFETVRGLLRAVIVGPR